MDFNKRFQVLQEDLMQEGFFEDALAGLQDMVKTVLDRVMQQAERLLTAPQPAIARWVDIAKNNVRQVAKNESVDEAIWDIPKWFWDKYCAMLDRMGGQKYIDQRWAQILLEFKKKEATILDFNYEDLGDEVIRFKPGPSVGWQYVSREALRDRWYAFFTVLLFGAGVGVQGLLGYFTGPLLRFLTPFFSYVETLVWELGRMNLTVPIGIIAGGAFVLGSTEWASRWVKVRR